MTPNAPMRGEDRRLVPISHLSTVLVVPIPKNRRQKRTLWSNFVSDLGFVLPIFGTALGAMLALGQAPFVGATLVTLCPVILTMRIYAAYDAYRERQMLAELERWYLGKRQGVGSRE